MRLHLVKETILDPAYRLLPDRMRNPQADFLMLVIGLQESNFKHRAQIGGPARGFWQFEQGGGVKGVLTHHASRPYALAVCSQLQVPPGIADVYKQLALNDVLSAAFARLLLWTDVSPIPEIGKVEESWEYYLRTWRPGKPHRAKWTQHYADVMDYFREQEKAA